MSAGTLGRSAPPAARPALTAAPPLTVDPLGEAAPAPAGSVPGLEALVLPVRLTAPAPVGERTVDVLVVGSGVAGLALARALAGGGLTVDLVTKGTLDEGSTRWAQGGIATADGPDDDPALHLRDTLVAGAGACDPDAVDVLVTQGPAAVAALARDGARFDHSCAGLPARTLEGGHSRARIVHAGGDATGAEVQRALGSAVSRTAGLAVHEHTMLLDLLTDGDGGVAGALVALPDPAGGVRTGVVRARATVLATGGWGQAFATTTNPAVATGDGLAAALRAGAAVADLEFVQFHPTALHVPTTPAGRRGTVPGGRGSRGGPGGPGTGAPDGAPTLLVTEALRGEGAVLVDRAGSPVMAGAHPLGDLAPRDVVAATMARAMAGTGTDHLYLDARGIGEARLLRRFPTVVARCRALGVDPANELLPVAPAAHFACGGVRADMSGRTSLPGLYALGEVACTGVHGANRLASNSLLEGLVVARRLAGLLLEDLPRRRHAGPAGPAGALLHPAGRAGLAARTARDAGVLRNPSALARLLADLAETSPAGSRGRTADRPAAPGRAAWEATNLHSVTAATVAAALRREESRGCHRRTDVPVEVEAWQRHRVTATLQDGRLRQEVRP